MSWWWDATWNPVGGCGLVGLAVAPRIGSPRAGHPWPLSSGLRLGYSWTTRDDASAPNLPGVGFNICFSAKTRCHEAAVGSFPP
jgi:hypothetical protein